MLGLGACPLADNRVQLVDEDSAGLVMPGKIEQHSDQFFGLASPFADDRGSRDVEEGGPAFCGDCLRQHGLAGPRRAEQQHASPGL
jgi:hypothetical protein